MKLSQAKALYAEGKLVSAAIMRNPSNLTQWFIMVRDKTGKSYIIGNEDDTTVVNANIEALFSVLKSIGFKEVLISL